MHRVSFPWRNTRLVVLALVVLSLFPNGPAFPKASAIAPPAPLAPATARQAPDDKSLKQETPADDPSTRTTKVIVDASDTATRTRLIAHGASLLVDYGTFSLWRVPVATAPAARQQTSLSGSATFDAIVLRDSVINTSVENPDSQVSRQQQRIDGEQFWLVQFVGPIKAEWLKTIEATGVHLVIYMPNHAYLVWGDDASLTRLEALAATDPVVQWTGPYHPEYRIAPPLKQAVPQRAASDMLDVTVQIYTTSATATTLDELKAFGGRIIRNPSEVLGFTNITLQVPAGQVDAIARRADVYNIEPYVAPTRLDEAQNQIMAGNLVRDPADNLVPSGPGYLQWLADNGFPTDPAAILWLMC
ncbi:MAG: hypothetical protein HC893_01440 [Chloroflexaceae bacterium]|nr:hypothetical protein [Chloroflexaceae bacterium]